MSVDNDNSNDNDSAVDDGDVDDDGGILIANRKRDRERTHGKKVEMGLDGDAEEMLGAAMSVIR